MFAFASTSAGLEGSEGGCSPIQACEGGPVSQHNSIDLNRLP